MQSKYNPQQKIFSYALWLLSRRDYAEKEMRGKLDEKMRKKNWQVGVTAAIEKLKEYNYIDDARFARRYIENRTNINPRGKYLVSRELQRKGIDKDLIETLWNEMAIDEHAVAEELLRRKFKSLQKYPLQKQKQKLIMLLSSRGFSAEIVYEIVAKVSRYTEQRID